MGRPSSGPPLRSRDPRVLRRGRRLAREPRLPRRDREGRRGRARVSDDAYRDRAPQAPRQGRTDVALLDRREGSRTSSTLDAEAPRHRVLLLSLALDLRAAQERRRHRHRRRRAAVQGGLQPGVPRTSCRRGSRRARSSSRPRCTRCGARSCSTSPSSRATSRSAARSPRAARARRRDADRRAARAAATSSARSRTCARQLAAFRALDLDPRRADARKAEAEATRAGRRVAQARGRSPSSSARREPQWSELAWRWLDDGVAHRALLEQARPDDACAGAARGDRRAARPQR